MEVSKDETKKTAAVTITVMAVCNQLDLTAFTGDLIVAQEDFESIQVTGVAADCGVLTLQGIDPFTIGCTDETEVVLTLTPSADDANQGTLIADPQDYNCLEGTPLTVEANGTYNITDGVLTIDYATVPGEGEESISGTVSITMGTVDNTDTDGDGVKDSEDEAPMDPCLPAQQAGYALFDNVNDIWGAGDCDGDGLTNLDESLDGTDPYNSDTDGDGVADNTDENATDPCLPVQSEGYTGYDVENTLWSASDCDGDGINNGVEVTDGTDPYVIDGEGCTSEIDTSVWNGRLDLEEDFEGDLILTEANGVAGCGTLTLVGDFLSFGCESSSAPSVILVLTASSEGATDGTVVAERSSYDCLTDTNDEFEASGTYDETTATIILDYTVYSEGEESFSGTYSVKPQQ
ncbi:hypothetical protein [Maribacter sp. 2210JD10-5]|uniref:hypothetical protein n=1 Tax=Maribacter sp. 2210JD10-5 TaxID=3386272 RepID=UPI0039BCCE02